MKRIIFMLMLTFALVFSTQRASAQQVVLANDFADNYSEKMSYGSDQLLAYNSSQLVDGTIEILVWANNAADDLCNYFSGSWGDVLLTIYCAGGGDPYTCTAYKVVQAACTVNGAVKLVIEGKYDAAARKALIGATKIFSISKMNSQHYVIKPGR